MTMKRYHEKDGITIKSRSGFLPWYEVQSGSTWNLKEELVKYCRDDVKVLSKSILAFRKIYIEGLDVDPFRYVTIASLCMGMYKETSYLIRQL